MVNDETPSTTIVSQYLTLSRKKQLDDLGFLWYAPSSSSNFSSSSSFSRVTPTPDAERSKQSGERTTRTTYDDQWDAMFGSLVAYKEKHGHCLVPKRYQDNPKLGTWVDTQRVQYKKMKKSMTTNASSPSSNDQTSSSSAAAQHHRRITLERVQRLEQLGFVWSIRDDWQKHYEELKEYHSEYGNCNVPARYAKNRRLGIWVSAQRQYYQRFRHDATSTSPLTPQRMELLNQLGFSWKVRCRETLTEDE